jgi:VWFA-related protein
MTRAVGLTLLAIGAIALHLQAQIPASKPQAVFRGGTDLVQVDVSVLDGRHRPVRGLTAADFTVLEDGQPREIQAFSEVYLPDRVQPREAAWTREVPTDVWTNDVARQEGRLVILLMDRSIPVGEPTVTARRIARAIVNQLGPGDLAAVVSTSNGTVQNLTADRSRLLRALDRGDPSTDISDEAKEIEASVFALTGRTWNALNDPRCMCGLCVLETIGRVADAVQSSTGRRKVLFFIGSELVFQFAGSPDPRQDVGCEKRLRDAREAMFTAVDRANLTVHSLDPEGLANNNPITRPSSTLRGVQAGPANAGSMGANLQRQGNLQVLPDRTGGRAVLNTNGPELSVPELFRESDSYYLIGFRPGPSAADGAFHKITVKTVRHGLDVHARSGYSVPSAAPRAASTSPAGALAPDVREALTGLLPDSATPIDLAAATFAGPDPKRAAVVLTVGLGALATAASGTTPIEVVASAFDTGGRPKGMSRQSVTLAQPSGQAVPNRRFDAQSRLDLPPGEYEIRVAVTGAGRASSVFSYVTIPPFATAPLTLSNIIVGATPGTLTAPKDFLSPLLPVEPTGRRNFRHGEPAVAFFRIYQGTGRSSPFANVDLRSSITDAAGKVVASSNVTLDAAQFVTGRSADHYVTLPIDTLPEGEYLLSVEASMGQRTAGRAMRFEVRP